MIKLIKLEWQTHNIGKYIRNAAITTSVLLIFVMAMAGEFNADETVALYGKSMLNASVELFTHMSYIIFTGTMLSSFIVTAYENRTITLMFSYPIKRQRILLSKILAVWIFNYAALVLSKFLLYAVLLLTKSHTHITAESIRLNDAAFYIEIFLSSAAMVSISCLALPIGLKMKSSRAVIITSVLITCLTQGNIGALTLTNNVPFYAALLLLSFMAIFLSIHRAEVKDV